MIFYDRVFFYLSTFLDTVQLYSGEFSIAYLWEDLFGFIKALFVKRGVKCIEVLGIKLIGKNAEILTFTVNMKYYFKTST